jgi:Legionella pneumophila major outer membrane protein precursor
MKVKSVALTMCLLLAAQRLSANFPCDFSNIGAYAEWIYFRPSIDTNFITETTSGAIVSTNKTVQIVPPYRSGWRVGLNYQCNVQESLHFRWSQLNTRETKNFTGTNFNSIAGGVGPSNVKDTLEFNYYAFEGVYGHTLFGGNCYFAELVAGVQYAWIESKESVSLVPLTGLVTAKQVGHFWGVGPEFGLDFGVDVWSRFSIVGSATASLLVSRVHGKVHGTNPGPTVIDDSITPLWRVVPTWDFRVGLRYDCAFRCLNLYAEAGYEVLSYVRGLRLLNLSVATATFEYSNADMHGPFVAFGLVY